MPSLHRVSQSRKVVIVGSSLAGIRAAETMRGLDGDCSITVIGAETSTPYDRPPLSKKFLSGEVDEERVLLRKQDMQDSLRATWRLGSPAVSLDTEARSVALADGSRVEYDGLIIATGGNARTLPNIPLVDGVHTLRTLNDAQSLRDALAAPAPGTEAGGDATAPRRFVVIGAGFIGLEAAATARQLGLDVTVLEGAPAPLIRGLGAEMGAAIAKVHDRNGVTVRCGARIEGIEQDTTAGRPRVTAVLLAGGERIPADDVLVGIGVSPAVEWLEGSGLTLRDGVVCDENLNAGVPCVYAAGDLLRWPNALFAHVEPDMRVEHWTNAAEQGAIAAQNLHAELTGGQMTPYSAVPFFWSDQFDARIQFLGRSHPDATVTVVAGSVEEGRFAAMYTLHDRVIAVLGVTMPKMVMPSRVLLLQDTRTAQALAHFEKLRNPPPAPARPA